MDRWKSTELRLTTGAGLIAIRRSNHSESVLFDGQPLGISWPDNMGSIGQYIALRQSDAVIQVNDWPGLPETIDPNGLNEQQCMDLLQPFENGRYVIEVIKLSADEFRQGDPLQSADPAAAYSTDLVPGKPFFIDGWYPVGHEADVFDTVAHSAIDLETVGSYREKIIDGYEPVAVVAGGPLGGVRYVLDGNHRLTAYCELLSAHHTPMPSFCWVSVKRRDAPPLDEEVSVAFLAEADAPQRARALLTEINRKAEMPITPNNESKSIFQRVSEAWQKRGQS